MCATSIRSLLVLFTHLKHPDEQHHEADGLQDAGVVLQHGLPAASPPQAELLARPVGAEVSRDAAKLLLDAGPRREGAAAAEGNLLHQVLPSHVAPEPPGRQRSSGETHSPGGEGS